MARRLSMAVLLAAVAAAVITVSPHASDGCKLAGSFRVYSASLYFDRGGAMKQSAVPIDYGVGSTSTATSTRLVITGSRWQFGSAKGRLKVSAITGADWKRWGIAPYGPTRKVTFTDWAKGAVTGPIEGTGANVDFFWLIFRAVPPLVANPGTFWVKFGHTVVPDSC